MTAFTCASCGDRCSGSSSPQILFHDGSGDGGIACSSGCAETLTRAGDITPVLDAATHLSRARDATHRALDAISRAHELAEEAHVARHRSFGGGLIGGVLGAAVNWKDAPEEAMALQDALHSCERPIQQAVFHMSALISIGYAQLSPALGPLASCDAGRTVSHDTEVEAARTRGMLQRIEEAHYAVWAL